MNRATEVNASIFTHITEHTDVHSTHLLPGRGLGVWVDIAQLAVPVTAKAPHLASSCQYEHVVLACSH
eukprot:scaffold51490_cov20-Tisochrysis_lutea.AAC.3